MKPLTKRENEIWQYIKLNPDTSTRVELQEKCKIGRGSLNKILDALVDRGKLVRIPPKLTEFRIR